MNWGGGEEAHRKGIVLRRTMMVLCAWGEGVTPQCMHSYSLIGMNVVSSYTYSTYIYTSMHVSAVTIIHTSAKTQSAGDEKMHEGQLQERKSESWCSGMVMRGREQDSFLLYQWWKANPAPEIESLIQTSQLSKLKRDALLVHGAISSLLTFS